PLGNLQTMFALPSLAASVFWFSLTSLRLFSSSPLTIVRKRPLDSLAASVVHKENSSIQDNE
ncbi:hypothetical protein, partial [uncultured Rikenella sp.]|uniref:hypothetical protein n=1 Tax=uncultured Rikenella sp. TaxID=368003 RepID=UPI002618CF7D